MRTEPTALRGILQLYDFADSEDTQKMIAGVTSVECRRVVGRADDDSGETGFVRGLEVTVTFNEGYFAGNSLFILASVLERFFGLYVSINSFTRMVAVVSTGQRERVLKRMGGQGGREDPPVSEQLLQEPWRFGFYQATRLLEWIAVRRRGSWGRGRAVSRRGRVGGRRRSRRARGGPLSRHRVRPISRRRGPRHPIE